MGKLPRRGDIDLRGGRRHLSGGHGGKDTLGRGNSTCKSPEAQKHLGCSRKRTRLGMTGQWGVCLRARPRGER